MTQREKVKDSMKNKILVIAVILTIGTSLMAITSSQSAAKVQSGLDQERYNRMVAEEKLEKASAKISSLSSELDNAKMKIQSIQAAVEEDKSTASELKAQLESVTKLKESLERKMIEIKNAQAVPVMANEGNSPVKSQ